MGPSNWRTGCGGRSCDYGGRTEQCHTAGFDSGGGAASQGMCLPPGAGKGKETETLLELPEKTDFSPLRHLTPTTVREVCVVLSH